jgi:hypothetical protein
VQAGDQAAGGQRTGQRDANRAAGLAGRVEHGRCRPAALGRRRERQHGEPVMAGLSVIGRRPA